MTFSTSVAVLLPIYQQYYYSIDTNYTLSITPSESDAKLVNFSPATTPQQQQQIDQLPCKISAIVGGVAVDAVAGGFPTSAFFDGAKAVYQALSESQVPMNQIRFNSSGINVLATQPQSQPYVVVYQLPANYNNAGISLNVTGDTEYKYSPKAGGKFTESNPLPSGPFSYTITVPAGSSQTGGAGTGQMQLPPTSLFTQVLQTTTSLQLVVNGLPWLTSANVTINGPGGYTQSITSGQTLTGLTSGSYAITASDATTNGILGFGGGTYIPTVTGSPAMVSPGVTPIVTVTYIKSD